MEQKYDVFISYSRKDYVDEKGHIFPENAISKIIQIFDKSGISYWFDKKGKYSLSKFETYIALKIKTCRIFVFVASENANKSEWTSREIAVADEFKKQIIPLKLDPSRYDDSIILRVQNLDFIAYYENEEQALEKLKQSVLHYREEVVQIEKEEEERRKKDEIRKRELLLTKIKEKEEELTEQKNRLRKIATEIAAAEITIKTLTQERREIKSNIPKIEQDLKILRSDNPSTSPISFIERLKQKLHSIFKTLGMAILLIIILTIAITKCNNNTKSDEDVNQVDSTTTTISQDLEPKFSVLQVTHSDSIQSGKRLGVIMHLSYKIENVDNIMANPCNIGIYFCTKDEKPIYTSDKRFQFVENSKQLSYSSPDLTETQETIHIFIPKSALSSPDNVKCDIVMFLGGIEYKSQEKFYLL